MAHLKHSWHQCRTCKISLRLSEWDSQDLDPDITLSPSKFSKINHYVEQVGNDPLLTSVVSSCRLLWSRSTSSISYTLISKGSFNGPDIGGKSTHWPAVLAFFPREEVSGRGAGISRLLWKPTKPCIWSDKHRLLW